MGKVARDEKGRFPKGQSGNPAGKAKGVRNEMTLQRLMLEKALREYIANANNAKKLLSGIDRVLDIAVNGDDKQAISAMKLLLEKVMPSMPPQIGDEANKTDTRLQIVIQTNANAEMPIEVIEGEVVLKEE